jgi:cation transport protein ChaC
MAFEVLKSDWAEVRAYLDARELVTAVYRDVWRPVRLADGQRVQALTYVVDESHEQFAGQLSLEAQLAMIRAGVGISGRNVDYVLNTAQHLARLGIRDRALMQLAEQLQSEAVPGGGEGQAA